MKYALIKDGIIQTILEWNENIEIDKNEYPDYLVVKTNENVKLGWKYKEGIFIPQELKLEQQELPTQEELKKQIEDTQKSMAEMMNLIAMQESAPKE